MDRPYGYNLPYTLLIPTPVTVSIVSRVRLSLSVTKCAFAFIATPLAPKLKRVSAGVMHCPPISGTPRMLRFKCDHGHARTKPGVADPTMAKASTQSCALQTNAANAIGRTNSTVCSSYIRWKLLERPSLRTKHDETILNTGMCELCSNKTQPMPIENDPRHRIHRSSASTLEERMQQEHNCNNCAMHSLYEFCHEYRSNTSTPVIA